MTDFLTVSEVSDYLGRDLSADDAAPLVVSMACETVRTITEQDFTETVGGTAVLDGSGTDVVILPQRPVSAAGTVVVNGETLEADDYGVTEEGLLIRTAGTATWSTWTTSPTSYWPQGRQNITVTYDYGYSGGTPPSDVRMVAMMIASRLLTQGVAQSEQVGQVNARYAVASTDLTAGEKAILRKYKR